MIIQTPRVNALFDKTVASLTEKGVAPSPMQSVWLYDLCRDVVMPDRNEVCAWLPAPVTLGCLSLYPMTVQSHLWLDDYAARWWEEDDIMDVLATAWASVHARREGVFARMTSRAHATARLASWGVLLPYTLDQLREALRRLLGDQGGVNIPSPIEPKAPADPLQWGEVLARAANTMHVAPSDVLLMDMETVSDVMRAAARDDGRSPETAPAKTRALEALRLAVKQIEDGAHE